MSPKRKIDPPKKRFVIEVEDEPVKKLHRVGNPKGNPDVPAFKAAQFRPGHTGNPTGKNGYTRPTVLSETYKVKLTDQVSKDVREQFGIPKFLDITYAQAIAHGLFKAAIGGDTPAAKEIRETTEGKLPENVSLIGKIDYNAGQTAKEQLLSKLGEEEKKQ